MPLATPRHALQISQHAGDDAAGEIKRDDDDEGGEGEVGAVEFPRTSTPGGVYVHWSTRLDHNHARRLHWSVLNRSQPIKSTHFLSVIYVLSCARKRVVCEETHPLVKLAHWPITLTHTHTHLHAPRLVCFKPLIHHQSPPVKYKQSKHVFFTSKKKGKKRKKKNLELSAANTLCTGYSMTKQSRSNTRVCCE